MFQRLQPLLPTVALVGLIVYFVFHGLTGERGLLLGSQRQDILAAKSRELSELETRRVDLEARARLLRDGSLSADLLEERARSMLGFADPKDYVIRIKP
ncbi:MAG: septum formation initiator family protein [Caulobacter sp.]|nr:septum formation initiator family protein [Caulobacter sp.]